MKDEALKLALEVLESERDKYLDWGDEDGAPDDVYEAITAIKQALAAPVQEPVAWVCYGAPGKRDIDFEEADINKLPIGTQLYTTPPAQPAVPDAMTSADIQEHIEYVAGWNDCRQAMLKGMKP